MFGFRPGCLTLHLAHIKKKIASRRRFIQPSHHTACSTTPMQGETPGSGRGHRAPLGKRRDITMIGFSTEGRCCSWSNVASGLRPPVIRDEDREPGVPRQGWQHAAASCVEVDFRAATLMPRMNPVERTLLRSQSGPCGAGGWGQVVRRS